jgi:hypothetical protein
MKEQLVNFVIAHLPHIISMVSYSYLEYRIGKSKNIQSNSLLELIQKNLWRKQ